MFLLLLAIVGPAQASHRRKSMVRKLEEAAEHAAAEATIPAPGDQEVCFSPEEHCDIKLVKFVRGARKSIDVAIFDINLDGFVEALVKKAKELPVRIVVDKRQAQGDKSGVPTLVKAGVEVRYGHQKGIMHNKFVLVDGGMVETGSFNHTRAASFANNENQIYLTNAKVVERFSHRFEKLWREGRAVRKSP